jgi:hypothetical protein
MHEMYVVLLRSSQRDGYGFVFLTLLYLTYYILADVKGIGNSKHVQEGHEQVLKALMEYCFSFNTQVPVKKKKKDHLIYYTSERVITTVR